MTMNAMTVQRYIDDNAGSGTYLLRDTGSGDFIDIWDMGALAQPTSGQLATIETTINDEKAAASERTWRNSELKDTDQWGMSDRTMSANMTTYRQDLRDMPDEAGFPNSHTRPTRPAGE